MKYKRLGNAGLKVSSLCLGTMTFGDGADKTMSNKMYELARDNGINFFDCANVYAEGESERILGDLIHHHREEVILSTKAYYPTGKGINNKGLSRLHLRQELEKSLKRLKTDYIDIYYLHCFDKDTPLNESLSTLNDFVRQGKILYVGLSNFAAWQIMKAISITNQRNYAPISCVQPMYNLLKRQCETEILPLAHSENLGVVPYSPLAGGMLTGKYLKKGSAKDGRFQKSEMYQNRYKDNTNQMITEKFINYCKDHSYNPVSLAISWVGSHKGISSPIIGARNMDQLKSALKSLDIRMTDKIRSEISNLSITPALATDREEERL
ncbi:MAG: aldo/keto reductase [Saonia sp.]